MRMTIHLVSAADYWALAIATRAARRRWWLRADPARGLTEADFEKAAETLRARLAEGPLRRKEMDDLVGKQQAAGAGLWLDMVRVPPSGTWARRRADLYAAAEHWLGPPAVSVDDAVYHLVRRYLIGFGPSTVAEIANWAGMAVGDVRPAVDRLPVQRVTTDDRHELVDLPGAALPGADTPAPVRFLAVWDAVLLVHARRKGVLAEEHRPLIFNTKTPHSVNTFLVDGVVAGTWRYEKGRVAVESFERLDRRTRSEVDDGAGRLAELHR